MPRRFTLQILVPFLIHGFSNCFAIVARVPSASRTHTAHLSETPRSVPVQSQRPLETINSHLHRSNLLWPCKVPLSSETFVETSKAIPSPIVSSISIIAPYKVPKLATKTLSSNQNTELNNPTFVSHGERVEGREVLIRLKSFGPATLYLNGRKIVDVSVNGEANLRRNLQISDVVGVHTRAPLTGKNHGVALSIRRMNQCVPLKPGYIRAIETTSVPRNTPWY